MTTWADRVSDLRAKGMSLVEIGARIGLAPTSVSDIEQGRTLEPSGDAAVALHSLHRTRGKTRTPSEVASRKRA